MSHHPEHPQGGCAFRVAIFAHPAAQACARRSLDSPHEIAVDRSACPRNRGELRKTSSAAAGRQALSARA